MLGESAGGLSVQTVRFAAGDRIITEGEAGDAAYVIVAGSVEVSVGEGGKAKALGTLGPGRRVRRDEPDRPRAAFRDGSRRHRRRVLRHQLRGVHRVGAGRAGTGDRADADPRPPPAQDQRADGADRPRHRPPHPAVAERDPGGDRRAGRPLRRRRWRASSASCACSSRSSISRSPPPRSRRPRRCSPTCCARASRSASVLWFGKVEADRPRDLEPLRRRRRPGVARELRPLGAQPRPPAPAGRARHHARPVPPQHVPRDAPRCTPATRAASRSSSAGSGSGSARGCGRSSASSSASRSPTRSRSRTSISAWRNGAGRWTSSPPTTR